MKCDETGKAVPDADHSLHGFPERIYVSTKTEYRYGGYSVAESYAYDDLEKAVPAGDPVEVGIYQLVRTAKFQKAAVEIKHTTKEIVTIPNRGILG